MELTGEIRLFAWATDHKRSVKLSPFDGCVKNISRQEYQVKWNFEPTFAQLELLPCARQAIDLQQQKRRPRRADESGQVH
jgi:hypothetical protein